MSKYTTVSSNNSGGKSYLSAQRTSDILGNKSWYKEVLHPRSIDDEDSIKLATDLHTVELTCFAISTFLDAHQMDTANLGTKTHMNDNVSATEASKNVNYLLVESEGDSIHLGSLTLLNTKVVEHIHAGFLTSSSSSSRYMAARDVEVSYAGTVTVLDSVNSFELMAFLKHFVGELYKTTGALLEQMAGHFFRSDLDMTNMLPDERSSFLRLQDKTLKTMVDICSRVELAGPRGKLRGSSSYEGAMLARLEAPTALRALAPTVADWLYSDKPLGSCL